MLCHSMTTREKWFLRAKNDRFPRTISYTQIPLFASGYLLFFMYAPEASSASYFCPFANEKCAGKRIGALKWKRGARERFNGLFEGDAAFSLFLFPWRCGKASAKNRGLRSWTLLVERERVFNGLKNCQPKIANFEHIL